MIHIICYFLAGTFDTFIVEQNFQQCVDIWL